MTLILFGVPILLFEAYLPERLQQGAETAVAVLIVYLAVRLLIRWRSGYFHLHAHAHPPTSTTTAMQSAPDRRLRDRARPRHGRQRGRRRPAAGRYPLDRPALASLVVLALFTAVSMTLLTGGVGLTLGSRPAQRTFVAAAPAIGLMSLAFGCWYAAAAWSLMPYPF